MVGEASTGASRVKLTGRGESRPGHFIPPRVRLTRISRDAMPAPLDRIQTQTGDEGELFSDDPISGEGDTGECPGMKATRPAMAPWMAGRPLGSRGVRGLLFNGRCGGEDLRGDGGGTCCSMSKVEGTAELRDEAEEAALAVPREVRGGVCGDPPHLTVGQQRQQISVAIERARRAD